MIPLTVSELQKLNFIELPLSEKIAVKQRGRSTPEIHISQPGISNNKKYIRSFNSVWYRRKTWLCGCKNTNSLFCFPCLLYGGELLWTTDGFKNMNKIKEKTEKHERSKRHIDNVVSLSLLGAVSISERHSEAYKLSVNEHNIRVRKNREVLSKILDCILFCGNFETLENPQNEKDDSISPGVFRQLISFACKSDLDFKANVGNAVFRGIPKAIQNEILDCLLEVYHEEIKSEIAKASFVAVMADGVTDISECAEMSISLRYMVDGEILERFWGFYTPENQTAKGLAECILEQLDVILHGNRGKLIAQTFDGTNFLMAKKSEVKEKIKTAYPNAHFILGYSEEPNAIMKNAASTTRSARIFFSDIQTMSTFFSKSPQRATILKKHVKVSLTRSPGRNASQWSVVKIYENLKPLKNCLVEILSISTTNETIAGASNILNNLNGEEFNFWLEFFYQMSSHIESVYNQMQSKDVSPIKINQWLVNFRTAIWKLKNSKYCENSSNILMAEARDVCDNLGIDVMDRYSFTAHFLAAKLLNKRCFPNFNNSPPYEEILQVSEAFPMIDKSKLETELEVFYSRPDLHEYAKLTDLLPFIVERNLDEVFSEIKTLIEIQLTLPMTTTENERCFPTQSNINTFLQSTLKSEKLNPLAVLSIENKYLRYHQHLKEKVIDLFAQIRTRQLDFELK